MNPNVVEKVIDEKAVLESLDSAISSYNTKDFETIAKESLAKTKSPKRTYTKRVKKTIEHIEEEKAESNIVIKNRSSKLQKGKLKTKKKVVAKKTKLSLLGKPRKIQRTKTYFKNIFQNYGRQILNASLGLAMVGFVSFSGYIAYAYFSGANTDLVQKVGAHAVLPTGESPKVYIIQSEKSEIFQNPLFKGIKVGDNVLSYTNAGKVYIYRNSEDKIVNIVNLNESSAVLGQ